MIIMVISTSSTSIFSINQTWVADKAGELIKKEDISYLKKSAPRDYYLIDREVPALKNIEDTDVYEVNPSFNEYSEELDVIKQDIRESRYSSALSALDLLIEKIRTNQRSVIEKYFPAEFNGFEIWDYSMRLGEFASQEDNYGVLFSRRYKNSQDHVIDINVVFSDPSILEYVNLIKNPKLVNRLENTEIAKIKNKYYALEKYSEEEMYCEKNIVVNNDLLLNVVANGIRDKAVIDVFISLIQIEKIEKYMAK